MKTMKNTVSLIGFIGSDAQGFSLNSGRKLCRATLATNDYYTDKSGAKVQQTQWHRLTGWGGIAKRMESQLQKGTRVILEGKLTHRNYEDKKGNKRTLSEIVVTDFIAQKSQNAEAA